MEHVIQTSVVFYTLIYILQYLDQGPDPVHSEPGG